MSFDIMLYDIYIEPAPSGRDPGNHVQFIALVPLCRQSRGGLLLSKTIRNYQRPTSEVVITSLSHSSAFFVRKKSRRTSGSFLTISWGNLFKAKMY